MVALVSASTSAVDTSSQLRRRMGDVACLTLDDCKVAALSMGVEPQYFYNNDFTTKGCFTKTNPTGLKKAFWSQGTVKQMSTTELTGVQERIMCEGSTPTPPTNKPTPAACKSIVEIAAGDERFSTLVAAVTAAGLVDTLSNNVGDLTVFAPTNEAFAKLPEATLNDLLKPENGDQLTSILTYHVVEGKVLSSDLSNNQSVVTLNGEKVTVSTGVAGTETGIRINDSNVISPFDVVACNGVIHAIDAVLIPPVPEPTPTPPTPTPPTPTPPTPSTPSFNCPAASFIGCTAPDPQDFEDECSTVGELCENGNPGEFCCRDGCPRNYCTAKPATSSVKQFSASNTNGSSSYSLVGAATAVILVTISSIML